MPATTTTNIAIGTLLDLVGQATQVQSGAKSDSAFDELLQKPAVVDRQRDADRPAETSSDRDSGSSPQVAAHDHESERAESVADGREKAKVKSAAESAPVAEKPQDCDEKSEDATENGTTHLMTQEIAAAAAVQPPATVAHADETGSEDESGPTAPVDGVMNAAAVKGKALQPTKTSEQLAVAVEIKPASAAEGAEKQEQQKQGVEKLPVESSIHVGPDSPRKTHEQPDVTNANPGAKVPAGDEPIGEMATALIAETAEREQHELKEDSPKSDIVVKDRTAPIAQATLDQSLPIGESKTPPVIAAATQVSPVANSTPVKSSDATANAITAGSPRRSRLPSEVLAPATAPVARRGHVEVDSARLLNRVARALSTAQSRDGEVRLRLSPAELGSLKVEIRVQDGTMVARLEAETDVAKAAIVDNLPALRERLAEQGVRIERFDVDLMQRQSGGFANQSDQRQSNEQPGALRVALPIRRSTEAIAAPALSVRAAAPSSSGLNVIV